MVSQCFFENGYRDEDEDLAHDISRPLKQAHLSLAYPVITSEIKGSLENIENESFQFYPAVIIDDKDKYHEGYWVFNIFEGNRRKSLNYHTVKHNKAGMRLLH